MPELLTFDGRVVHPISLAMYAFVRAHLPRTPAVYGRIWVAETCWIATYTHAVGQPGQFAGWQCLNPRQETPDA
jgi:hypothetical protein